MPKYVQTNFTAADMLGVEKVVKKVETVKPKAAKPAKVEPVIEKVVEPEVVVEEQELVVDVVEEIPVEEAE